MNRERKMVKQECNCCGHEFWLEYHADGTYTYFSDPCDCEAGFSPVPGSPTLSEWLEKIKK